MTDPVYIEDIIGQVVASTSNDILTTIQQNELAARGATNIMGIDYQFGPGNELVSTLAQMDKDPTLRFYKYPLVWLVTDITEKRGITNGIIVGESLQLYFIHQTDKNYKAKDRLAKVFKPVLEPLYYAFMDEIASHPLVNNGGLPDLIKHQKTRRYYAGSAANQKNLLNDFVDAIDVSNLSLLINYQLCLTAKNI